MTKELSDYKVICDELAELLERKNADYGDSVAKNYAKFGELSMLIRLSDKMERLEKFAKNPSDIQITNESITDVYMDIAGYAINAIRARNLMKEGKL